MLPPMGSVFRESESQQRLTREIFVRKSRTKSLFEKNVDACEFDDLEWLTVTVGQMNRTLFWPFSTRSAICRSHLETVYIACAC